MLEVLRVLSQQHKRLRHSVVFLFNGAEETPLQAAHGFITQHEWAKEVRGMKPENKIRKKAMASTRNTANFKRFLFSFFFSVFKFRIGRFEWQRNSLSIGSKTWLAYRCKHIS